MRCSLRAGATLYSIREGTRARISSSAHPGGVVDVDQRWAADTGVEGVNAKGGRGDG